MSPRARPGLTLTNLGSIPAAAAAAGPPELAAGASAVAPFSLDLLVNLFKSLLSSRSRDSLIDRKMPPPLLPPVPRVAAVDAQAPMAVASAGRNAII